MHVLTRGTTITTTSSQLDTIKHILFYNSLFIKACECKNNRHENVISQYTPIKRPGGIVCSPETPATVEIPVY